MQFSGGPGLPKDWVAIYPSGACSPTCPVGSTLWDYCATDTQTATASGVTSGTVILDSTSNSQNWPLGSGSWDVLYLVNDGYDPIAMLTIQVVGGTPVCTSGAALKDTCTQDSDCCSGLVCLSGNSNGYEAYYGYPAPNACSNPGCNIFDGVCPSGKDSDCCGQLSCIGNVCQ